MRNRHEKNTIPVSIAPVAPDGLQRPQVRDRCLDPCRGTDERIPDSAWAVLNTLSPDEMGQNCTRAHYALLYTQAQDKTYRDETNDSLISIAVDYYRHTDDARRKFLSYYYKGRVHFNVKGFKVVKMGMLKK